MKVKIDRLVALDNDKWHHVTMRMGWVYRTNGMMETHPLVLAIWKGETPSKEEWTAVRKKVNAARRSVISTEKRHIQRMRREAHRRYMRDYMRKRRASEAKQ